MITKIILDDIISLVTALGSEWEQKPPLKHPIDCFKKHPEEAKLVSRLKNLTYEDTITLLAIMYAGRDGEKLDLDNLKRANPDKSTAIDVLTVKNRLTEYLNSGRETYGLW